MKKLLSVLLICNVFIAPCLIIFADTSISEITTASSKTEAEANKNVSIVSQDNVKSDKKESKDLIEALDNSKEIYKVSKWEITKYLAKWFGITFINDVKSYVMFYPLFKLSQLISYLAVYFPTYAFYKITGIDIPAKVSSFFNKNESLNIIGQNLYNFITLTLSSFLFKWGNDLYFYLKTC